MLLLISSAVDLSFGLSGAANSIAVYAFYALVVGVALQVASYIKYGEGAPEEVQPVEVKQEPVSSRWSGRRKVAAISVLVVVVLAVGVAVYYPQSPLGSTLPRQTYPKLTLAFGSFVELHEPDNSTNVVLAVGVSGGNPPYNFTASWSDGFVQSGAAGLFLRTFFSNQTIPQTINVSVTSADGQKAGLPIDINSTTTN